MNESSRTLVRVTDRAEVVGRVRAGYLFRWYLHGGSEYKQVVFPEEALFEAGGGGPLIVDEVWAGSRGIYSGTRLRPHQLWESK